MNLQVERIAELAIQLQLTGIEPQAFPLAQQAAKEEWDYLQFLEKYCILKCRSDSNGNRLCLPVWLDFLR